MLFSSKNFMEICSKTHQIAHFKKILGEACPRTPLANALQAVSRHETRPAHQKVGPHGKSCIRPWPWTTCTIIRNLFEEMHS